MPVESRIFVNLDSRSDSTAARNGWKGSFSIVSSSFWTLSHLKKPSTPADSAGYTESGNELDQVRYCSCSPRLIRDGGADPSGAIMRQPGVSHVTYRARRQ